MGWEILIGLAIVIEEECDGPVLTTDPSKVRAPKLIWVVPDEREWPTLDLKYKKREWLKWNKIKSLLKCWNRFKMHTIKSLNM